MTKKITHLALFLTCYSLFSQVGIGTVNPQKSLQVAGSTLIQNELTINVLPIVNLMDEDFKIVSRIQNSVPAGEIKILNVDSLNVAPINVINYHITNISLDNLVDLDLQYDANKYVVGLSNFRYVGDAILKQTVDTDKTTIGTWVMRTFISDGTWHLEIRNRDLHLISGSVSYHVTLIVYDKSYYRHLPPIFTDLGGSNSGSASSVPDIN